MFGGIRCPAAASGDRHEGRLTVPRGVGLGADGGGRTVRGPGRRAMNLPCDVASPSDTADESLMAKTTFRNTTT